MYVCVCMLFKRDFRAWSNETWPVKAKYCLRMWFSDHGLTPNTYVYQMPSLQTLSRPMSPMHPCCAFLQGFTAACSLFSLVLLPLSLPTVPSPSPGTFCFPPFLHVNLVPSHRELPLQRHKRNSEFIAYKAYHFKKF